MDDIAVLQPLSEYAHCSARLGEEERLQIQTLTAPEKMCEGLPEPVHHLLGFVALDTTDERTRYSERE
jgi:hypothetical protein